MMRIEDIALVFLGGGFGSCFRYVLSIWLNPTFSSFPLGTWIANVVSCVLVGLVSSLLIQKYPSTWLKLFILVGFCGGFSTFSTWINEINHFLKQELIFSALWYATLSMLCGWLGVWISHVK